MTPHAQAILERLHEKPFMHGYSSAMPLTGYGFSESDRLMRDAFAELVAVGLVVETVQTDRASRYVRVK